MKKIIIWIICILVLCSWYYILKDTPFNFKTQSLSQGLGLERSNETPISDSKSYKKWWDPENICLEQCTRKSDISNFDYIFEDSSNDHIRTSFQCKYGSSCWQKNQVGRGYLTSLWSFRGYSLSSAELKSLGSSTENYIDWIRLYAYNYPVLWGFSTERVDLSMCKIALRDKDMTHFTTCLSDNIGMKIKQIWLWEISDFSIVVNTNGLHIEFANQHKPEWIWVWVNKNDSLIRFYTGKSMYEKTSTVVGRYGDDRDYPYYVDEPHFDCEYETPCWLGFQRFKLEPKNWIDTIINYEESNYNDIKLRSKDLFKTVPIRSKYNSNPSCQTDIVSTCECWDGYTQPSNFEYCDDGNTDNDDFCTNDCIFSCRETLSCKKNSDCAHWTCTWYKPEIKGFCVSEMSSQGWKNSNDTSIVCSKDSDCPAPVPIWSYTTVSHYCNTSKVQQETYGLCKCDSVPLPSCGNKVCEPAFGERDITSKSCCQSDCDIVCPTTSVIKDDTP